MLEPLCGLNTARIPFIPADKSWTAAQISDVLHDSEQLMVLVDSTTPALLADAFLERCTAINLDTIQQEARCNDALSSNLQHGISRQCCYIIYTSGSCGDAKGILGTEAGILNRCKWMQKQFPFQFGDKIGFTTATTFVDSIWQMFGPLVGGVAMVIIPEDILRDASTCVQTLGDTGITHVVSTFGNIECIKYCFSHDIYI